MMRLGIAGRLGGAGQQPGLALVVGDLIGGWSPAGGTADPAGRGADLGGGEVAGRLDQAAVSLRGP